MGIQSKIERGIAILVPNRKRSVGKVLSFLGSVLLGFLLVCFLEITHDFVAIAQETPIVSNNASVRAEDAANTIYQKLPYLPKENQYRRQETGEIDPQHTLISRFIRYHQDFKKRATRYRLDWKLTLADYLGVNEVIEPDTYPGKVTLKTNPAETDIKAIQALNRRQREELVNLLALIYKPQVAEKPTTPNAPKTPQPTPLIDSGKPSLGKPGDAQLLMP